MRLGHGRGSPGLRAHGSLFGLDENGTSPVAFTFGAFGRLLSQTVHPEVFNPASGKPLSVSPRSGSFVR